MSIAKRPRRFVAQLVIGRGSYGIVYKAVSADDASLPPVAIKKVQSCWAVREVQALRRLAGCPNVIQLLGVFPGRETNHQELSINIVLEYVKDTLQRIIRHHKHEGLQMATHSIILYSYQLLRGLGCLRQRNIVHRDVKPANLLVNPQTGGLKICDFGTAIEASEAPTAASHQVYVCSRYYRAPELIMSGENYSFPVDTWSAGCVVAELILGQPIFAGRDGVDQLQCIIEILGTPSPQDIASMNPLYDAAVHFGPPLPPMPLDVVLNRKNLPPTVLQLLAGLLMYNPENRLMPLEALGLKLYDVLRFAADKLDPRLQLFDFSTEELQDCPPELQVKLRHIPAWQRRPQPSSSPKPG